jgi:hypothetical protein
MKLRVGWQRRTVVQYFEKCLPDLSISPQVDAAARTVAILAIGVKIRNRLFVGGVEIKL